MWNCLKYGTWKTTQPGMDAVNALVAGGYAPLAAMVLASRGIGSESQANAYLDADALQAMAAGTSRRDQRRGCQHCGEKRRP